MKIYQKKLLYSCIVLDLLQSELQAWKKCTSDLIKFSASGTHLLDICSNFSGAYLHKERILRLQSYKK